MRNKRLIKRAYAIGIIVITISIIGIITWAENVWECLMYLTPFIILYFCIDIMRNHSSPDPELRPGMMYKLHDIIKMPGKEVFIFGYADNEDKQDVITEISIIDNAVWGDGITPERGKNYIATRCNKGTILKQTI